MRVGEKTQSRLRVSRPPPHPPQCAHWGTFPPQGGRLWARSNREEFGPLWDVWIHILGIGAECACWRAGGPDVLPLLERRREPAPSSAPSGGTFPPGGRLRKNKKGQVWNLSLKTQRRNAVSHKISLVPFFFKERNCLIPSRCPSSGPPGGRGGRPQTGCSEIRLQCARPCWGR